MFQMIALTFSSLHHLKLKKILEERHKEETEFSHLNEAQMTNTETTPYQNCNFKRILSFQCNYVITNMLNKASYFTLKLKLHSALTAVDFKNQHYKRCLLLGFQIQRYNVPLQLCIMHLFYVYC